MVDLDSAIWLLRSSTWLDRREFCTPKKTARATIPAAATEVPKYPRRAVFSRMLSLAGHPVSGEAVGSRAASVSATGCTERARLRIRSLRRVGGSSSPAR